MKKNSISKRILTAGAVAITTLASIGIVSTLSSCSLNELWLKSLALPSVKSYVNTSDQAYTINDNTKMAIDLNAFPSDKRQIVLEIFQNVIGEYYAKLQGTHHSLASHPTLLREIPSQSDIKGGEILFELLTSDSLPGFNEVTKDNYPEAYTIEVGKTICVKAFNEQGWLLGARTLLQMQITNINGILFGTISDWPKVKQRGIEFDFSGRGYTLKFVEDLLKSMAWDKLNTLALRFASGGMRLNCHKVDEAPEDYTSTNGTWFKFDKSQFQAGASGTAHYNLNQNYRDNSPLWDWENNFSEFGEILNLAAKLGVNIIPGVNLLTHAWFITDLTLPHNSDDTTTEKSEDGYKVTEEEYQWDFALYDNNTATDYPHGKRMKDCLNLKGDTPGSKMAIALCEKFLTYISGRFMQQGNWANGTKSFCVGGDEYLETFEWRNATFAGDDPSNIIKSIYSSTKTFLDALKVSGIQEVTMWSDELLKTANTSTGFTQNWPNATSAEWNATNIDFDTLTLKHWWAQYGDATPADFTVAYSASAVKGGVQRMVNYNSDKLYFSDDASNTSTAPTAQDIYEGFHPGQFAGEAGEYFDDIGNINGYPTWLKGAMMSVWWDSGPQVLPIVDGTLKAFAQKCWNGNDSIEKFSLFAQNCATLGKAPLSEWN